jgi:hypothetical protein
MSTVVSGEKFTTKQKSPISNKKTRQEESKRRLTELKGAKQ